MLTLPNGCRCSTPTVIPKNWEKANADIKKDWVIQYRFYGEDGTAKRVLVRGMNNLKVLEARQKVTKGLLADELSRLIDEGYNPITKTSIPPIEIDYEISPNTPFVKAITQAIDKLTCSEKTKTGIKCDIEKIEAAAKAMKLDRIPISEVKRKHIKLILERVAEERNLSPGTYNHYRAHLMMVFTELVDLEAIELNPLTAIKKRKEIKKLKRTLTDTERIDVDKHLKEHNYNLWRYMHIFYHSGARTSELFKLQGKDVDLVRQTFKITVIKGKFKREVEKVIKDLALPLWIEVMAGCKPDQFVFSRNLKPGNKPVNPEQNSKRWYKFVLKNEDLNVSAGFYSLKHLHSDSIAELLSIEDAMKHNSHTSIKTTKIYATGEAGRKDEKLKKLDNPL